jgi:hypothetical protein
MSEPPIPNPAPDGELNAPAQPRLQAAAPGARFCLRCRAPLPPECADAAHGPRCVRCGLPYNPLDRRSFATSSRALRVRWIAAFVLAVGTGVFTYGQIVLGADQGLTVLGYSAFFGVPLAVGAVLGYLTQPSIWLALLLSLFAIVCITFFLCSLQLSGLFCGATLGIIFLGPAFVGVLLGAGLRLVFRRSAWDQRRWYVTLLLAGSPLAGAAVEGRLPREPEIAEVSTAMTFAASPQQAWDSILFYEQVEHAPPWLLTLALPRPVRTEGSKAAVGDVEHCLYERGRLVKRITRCEAPHALGFVVVEQHLHFERDVTLRDGAFVLEALPEGGTRVVLTTRYVRHLSPAWLWGPLERTIVHTLHGHVLEGMRRRAQQEDYEEGPEGSPREPPGHPERPGESGEEVTASRT